LITLNKSHLVERVGTLPSRILAKVERGVILVLNLEKTGR
jgi:hypothetical protein